MDNKPEEKKQGIDYRGALLLISGLLVLICPLIFGQKYHWAWWIFGLISLGLLLLMIFLKYEVQLQQQGKPILIDPALLRHRPFALCLSVIFFYNFTSGLFICYPYYLQQFLHLSPVETGLAIIPYGAAFFLGPFLSPRIQYPPSTLIFLGLGFLIVGFSLTALYFYFYQQPGFTTNITLFLAGLGHGIIMPVIMRESISLVTKDKAGQASGLINIAIQVGSVTGGTVIGTLFFGTIEIFGFFKAFALAIGMIAVFQVAGIFSTAQLLKYNKSL